MICPRSHNERHIPTLQKILIPGVCLKAFAFALTNTVLNISKYISAQDDRAVDVLVSTLRLP